MAANIRSKKKRATLTIMRVIFQDDGTFAGSGRSVCFGFASSKGNGKSVMKLVRLCIRFYCGLKIRIIYNICMKNLLVGKAYHPANSFHTNFLNFSNFEVPGSIKMGTDTPVVSTLYLYLILSSRSSIQF